MSTSELRVLYTMLTRYMESNDCGSFQYEIALQVRQKVADIILRKETKP